MQYKCRIHYAASATIRTIHSIYRRHPVPDKGRVPLLYQIFLLQNNPIPLSHFTVVKKYVNEIGKYFF